MPSLRACLAVAAFLLAPPALAAPNVATDTGPIQSIAARVMQGIGAPGSVLPPGASPHDYTLRPSDAALLDHADLVIWIGPELTPWLSGPIEALAGEAKILELENAPGVTLLPIRAGGPFEPHVEQHEEEHAEEHSGSGDHAGMDGHVWLDPRNAAAFATAIAAALAKVDPENAAAYEANATDFDTEMIALEAEVAALLQPAHGKPFLVFHDAYQYFEDRFDVPAAGSVSLHDNEAPGARRIAELRARVTGEHVVCAFAEPGFDPKLMATITEGSDVRAGTLDPEGLALPRGPGLYPTLIREIAGNLVTCLNP